MIDDSVLAVGSTSAVSSAVLRRARHLDFFENVLTDYSFYGRNARTRTGTVEESPVLALFQSKIHPPLGAAVRSYIYTRTHIIVYSENSTSVYAPGRCPHIMRTGLSSPEDITFYGPIT